ncbi:serpin-ZX-like [Solanum tuberosum]|uniref:serpin-ZX-like n=1 Tax=Solanum tuberosum TaxID=4113 RepID=UPI0003D26866|nr:PREDICTED: serpin-ZX-like [Solanum tuberosum]
MDEAMMKKRKRKVTHTSSSQANIDMEQFVTNQTDVSFRLTKQVFSEEVKGDSNLVFSPLSIQIILGLIAFGSNKPTKSQLLCFLKSKSIDELNSLYSHIVNNIFADGSPNGGPILSVANGAWIDRSTPFKPSFKEIVKKVYKATSKSVDFQNKVTCKVVNKVNRWAKKNTNGLIEEILPHGAVDNMTRLILANALYFKGEWDEKFNASKTKKHKFHLVNGRSVRAPFMTSWKKQYIRVFKGFKVLQLPYKRGIDTHQKLSMYFILPDAHDGLPDLLDKITSKPGFLDHHIPSRKVSVGKFLIPKFKISFGFEASKVLKGLGLTLPFIDGLTEMVDADEPLAVSQVFHKSFIEVNEEGTEAAAVTAMTGCSMMMVKEEIDFVADHPFLFLVKDETTGAVLFMGTLLNPLAV